MKTAYVCSGDGWSIARIGLDDDDIEFWWWCGPSHEWVSPHSSHWHMFRDCWNVVFPSLAKARAFARGKGWE